MKLLNLTWINIKRYIKNPMILIMIVGLPMIMPVILFMSNDNIDKLPIGIINEDKGTISANLIEELGKNYTVKLYEGNPSENYDKLNNNEIGELFYIPENFTTSLDAGNKPKIELFKAENQLGGVLAEQEIDTFINNKIKGEKYPNLKEENFKVNIETKDEKENKGDFQLILLFACYFMFIGGSAIAEDLIKIKNAKVLKRAITTANKDYEVLGGIFLAIFILQGILSFLVFAFIKFVLKIQGGSLGMAFIVINLSSLVSTSVILATTRWMKNITLVSLGVVVYSLISLVLSIVANSLHSFENASTIIVNISKLFPFYWLMDIINNNNLFPNILVLILIALCFFTAGSFKLRSFAKD